MAPKKTYYYDYRATAQNLEPAQSVEPVAPVNPSEPPTPFTAATPEPPPPSPADTLAPPPQRSNILSVILVIILVVAIGYLAFSLIPNDYSSCVNFPGSDVPQDLPGTCTTFYGKAFSREATAVPPLEITEPETSTETESQLEGNFTFPTPLVTPTPANQADVGTTQTTKGGLPAGQAGVPLSTPAPTTKPVAQPTVKSEPVPTPTGTVTVANDWVRHRYPDQKFAVYLPKGWSASDAVRNIDTNITTIKMGGDALVVRVQTNWDNTGTAHDQAVNFEVDGSVPAIKVSGDTYTTVYFEKNGLVYIFTCHNSVWNACQEILKTLIFI